MAEIGGPVDAAPLAVPARALDTSRVPDTLRNGMKADVTKIIETARTAWLTKYQVMYLLEHWAELGLALSTSTPQKPPSGTLFLFDRSVNRYFRKDGHNWRKKGYGCTVRETHEKIKIAEKGVLNCYYAHSEEATGIMRRSYWLLESDDNVVLVHYLEGMASRRMITNSDGTPVSRTSNRRRKQSAGAGTPSAVDAANCGGMLDANSPDKIPRAVEPVPAEMFPEPPMHLLYPGYPPGAHADPMHVTNATVAAAMQAQQHPTHILTEPTLLSHSLAQNPQYLQSLGLTQPDIHGASMNMLVPPGVHLATPANPLPADTRPDMMKPPGAAGMQHGAQGLPEAMRAIPMPSSSPGDAAAPQPQQQQQHMQPHAVQQPCMVSGADMMRPQSTPGVVQIHQRPPMPQFYAHQQLVPMVMQQLPVAPGMGVGAGGGPQDGQEPIVAQENSMLKEEVPPEAEHASPAT